jgi:hypothetical protein
VVQKIFPGDGASVSLSDQKIRFQALCDWFQSSQGAHVGKAFAAELIPLTDLLYGDSLLQLGNSANNPWLHSLRYHHKWVATPYSDSKSDIITAFDAIPLERNSVDCILAPLTMQAFTHKINPLDEMDRILKPMGFIVFLGINPFSLWNFFMHFGKHSCFGTLSPHSMSFFFIKRAMLHRGYIQCSFSSFYFIPPVYKEQWIHRLEFLNEVGKMMWPSPAGFYCLVMQKFEERFTNLLQGTIQEELLNAERLPVQTICPHDN